MKSKMGPAQLAAVPATSLNALPEIRSTKFTFPPGQLVLSVSTGSSQIVATKNIGTPYTLF
jgi:hypothetical protein